MAVLCSRHLPGADRSLPINWSRPGDGDTHPSVSAGEQLQVSCRGRPPGAVVSAAPTVSLKTEDPGSAASDDLALSQSRHLYGSMPGLVLNDEILQLKAAGVQPVCETSTCADHTHIRAGAECL